MRNGFDLSLMIWDSKIEPCYNNTLHGRRGVNPIKRYKSDYLLTIVINAHGGFFQRGREIFWEQFPVGGSFQILLCLEIRSLLIHHRKFSAGENLPRRIFWKRQFFMRHFLGGGGKFISFEPQQCTMGKLVTCNIKSTLA